MDQPVAIEFERAVRLLAQHLPLSEKHSRKPILFHAMRVGVYLYEQEYKPEIVLAGVLHDALEWSSVNEKILNQEFGETIVQLVKANTKDDSIVDRVEKIQDIVRRCVAVGQDALIVKAADILDSFSWYSAQKNANELDYCEKNAQIILALKPKEWDDKIFAQLSRWVKQRP